MTNDLVIVSKSEIEALGNLPSTLRPDLEVALQELLNKAQPVNTKPVATVKVGGNDFGPFEFQETAYGVDKLSDGKHKLYTTSQPAIPEGYQLVPIELKCSYIRDVMIRYANIAEKGNSYLYGDFYAELLEAAKKEGV